VGGGVVDDRVANRLEEVVDDVGAFKVSCVCI
jgi:hypothetical protein